MIKEAGVGPLKKYLDYITGEHKRTFDVPTYARFRQFLNGEIYLPTYGLFYKKI